MAIQDYTLRILNSLFLAIYLSFTITNIVFLRKIWGRKSLTLPRNVLILTLWFSISQIGYGILVLIWNSPYDTTNQPYKLSNLGLLVLTVISYFCVAVYILFVWIGIIATQSFGLSKEKAARRRKGCFIGSLLYLVLSIGLPVIFLARNGFTGPVSKMASQFLLGLVICVPFAGSIIFIVFARRLKNLIMKLRSATAGQSDRLAYKLTLICIIFVFVLDLNVGFGILALVDSFPKALSPPYVWPFLYLPEMTFNLSILLFFNPMGMPKKTRTATTAGAPTAATTTWDSSGSHDSQELSRTSSSAHVSVAITPPGNASAVPQFKRNQSEKEMHVIVKT